ncbi:MAG: glycosyltransferase family 2 protein [Capsulimonadales bacterium]|nr:glycosyltransferase family 2 protein [Capsulimonadales bacterium]
MSTAPIVTVAIPTRNRADLLLETLESLRAQTRTDWEAVVVDDRSTDHTAEAVRTRYGNDSRVRFLIRQGETAGAPACRNQGMREGRGRYVIFLDSDDLLMPHCLERRVALLETRPDVDYAVFQGELFAERPGDLGKPWNRFTDEPDLDRFLKRDVPWQTSGPIWTRAGLEKLGEWDESLICWQDYDFHIRSVILGMRYEKVESADYLIRRSPNVSDNIHLQNSTPAHLKTRLRLLRKITNELRARGRYDRHTRHLLTFAFLALAREWIYRLGNREEARKAWEECLEEGVVDAVRFREGAFGLKYMEARRGLTPLYNAYLNWRWASESR